jgi:hypothetical protein
LAAFGEKGADLKTTEITGFRDVMDARNTTEKLFRFFEPALRCW